MSEVVVAQPLKYFSLGLSSCLHILLLILLFAGIYHHVTSDVPNANTAHYQDTDTIDDYVDYAQDDEAPSNAASMPEMLTAQPEEPLDTIREANHSGCPLQEIDSQSDAPYDSTPEAAQDSVQETQEISAAPQQSDVAEPVSEKQPTSPIPQTTRVRRRPRPEKWTRQSSSEQTPAYAGSSSPQAHSQQAHHQMGQAISSGFSSFIAQEQRTTTERLARHGHTTHSVENDRHDYHTRVLEAIKATTHYFVKPFYAQAPFTTKKIHVSFSLDTKGVVTSLKIEPSSGNFELDQAIRQFVMSAHFPKKPQSLSLIHDEPYDFYILPLSLQFGENTLKLVACF